jgi:hypothetical protein
MLQMNKPAYSGLSPTHDLYGFGDGSEPGGA